MIQVATTIREFRQLRQQHSGTLGLVPTMGYLHDGHLSLVRAASADNDSVAVSIFVNPTQFGEGDDFDSYPRDMDRDLKLLSDAGVSLVFAPPPSEMYPPDFQTHITVENVSQGLEGAQRPGHFRGVATVVTKLFNVVQPDRAYFGQKDAQQVVVLKQLVKDLNIPVKIVICPIQREPDGLAMSSRNIYLQPDERQCAAALNRALQEAAAAYDAGEREPEQLRQIIREYIATHAGVKPDYVSVADARTLAECDKPTETPLLVSIAVKVGKPRLLDNMLLPAALNTRDGATRALGASTDV